MSRLDGPKDVYVSEYDRIRFGRTEHVCEHWRSSPRPWQFTLFH
jgi:hypothetical protein